MPLQRWCGTIPLGSTIRQLVDHKMSGTYKAPEASREDTRQLIGNVRLDTGFHGQKGDEALTTC